MTTLLLGFHNHQPEGNFGHVFRQAFDDCYAPLLRALTESPRIKASLHHTGPLLEWIEHNEKGYFAEMRALVERGQVELLGGGFYEPMLAILPERDAHGQIVMMADYLESHFGVRPTGMWLAERVWEPALAQLIAEAGMRYTLVDDGHFRSAGMGGPLGGYYVTEKAGVPLALFPIDMELRGAIPFRSVDETMAAIHERGAQAPGHCLTYGDDGEKFGVWPGTKEWVWEKGWLKTFFARLSDASDIETSTFAAVMKSKPPTGRVYLPTASYEEMGEWSLPADAQANYLAVRGAVESRGELDRARPFLRGGIWQGFLAKYPEADHMHKKMVRVSAQVEAAAEGGENERVAFARRELYKAQCNCAYWHGLFGGLYLNYLRDSVYHHLIEAEVVSRELTGRDGASTEVADIDSDLRPEVALESNAAAVYIKPDLGGVVYELDYRAKRFNLLNVLGRRPEGYHAKLQKAVHDAKLQGHGGDQPVSIHDLTALKSTGLETLLHYDRFPRGAFVDHFLDEEVALDALSEGRFAERGDFAGAEYQVAESGTGTVTLARTGTVNGRALTLRKTFTLSGDGDSFSLRCRYQLSGDPQPLLFAPEIAVTLLAGNAPDRYYQLPGQDLLPEARRLDSRGVVDGGVIELVNGWDRFAVRLEASPAAALWRYPLETASQSEGGFERTYQGSILQPHFHLHLQGPVEVTVTLSAKAL